MPSTGLRSCRHAWVCMLASMTWCVAALAAQGLNLKACDNHFVTSFVTPLLQSLHLPLGASGYAKEGSAKNNDWHPYCKDCNKLAPGGQTKGLQCM